VKRRRGRAIFSFSRSEKEKNIKKSGRIKGGQYAYVAFYPKPKEGQLQKRKVSRKDETAGQKSVFFLAFLSFLFLLWLVFVALAFWSFFCALRIFVFF
jgi:hypothetical protein